MVVCAASSQDDCVPFRNPTGSIDFVSQCKCSATWQSRSKSLPLPLKAIPGHISTSQTSSPNGQSPPINTIEFWRDVGVQAMCPNLDRLKKIKEFWWTSKRHLMVKSKVQLVSPATQEMQVSRSLDPGDVNSSPPQMTSLPPDIREMLCLILGSGRSGM